MKKGKWVKCYNCGKLIYVFPSRIKKGKKYFCSLKCRYEAQRKYQKKEFGKRISETCKRKGIKPIKPFRWTGKKRPPISDEWRKHMSEAQKGNKNALGKHQKPKDTSKIGKYWLGKKGAKNPNWKGGISKISAYFKRGEKYRLWRKAVLERDNFTCQITGQHGGKLEVHHINNFADFPELRLDVNNGITLSKKIHREFHRIYGRHNNTREQLEEFAKLLKSKQK